ncbi:nestin isoform X2 [Paroedura picta]|uniref:nestin isoform X2 n=1 Tax=Paroedura picta TaxID=143630 RepID=UPI004057B4A9
MESLLELQLPLGEESLQMWDLNKRLEAYLARVKFLEEENEGLKSQIQRLKGCPAEDSWRGRCEEQVAAWRAHLEEAFREKNAAELARASLAEEVQQVKSRCQKERAVREEAQKILVLGKQGLEEEKRAHIWLREKAAQLEKEAEALREAHEEERTQLEQEAANFSRSLESLRGSTLRAFRPMEVEDYSQGLACLWRGAVETYQAEVTQLEAAFREVEGSLEKTTQSNHRQRQQLQHLGRDLAGLKGQKEALEERLALQWQLQQGEAEKFQLTIEGLEGERQALTTQIAQVLDDRQQLMHLKLSLSLEVATYRTLLEAESTRLQIPGDPQPAIRLQDSKWETSKRQCQAVSLERGLSSTNFLKGSVTPQWPKSQSGPSTINVGSVLPQSRSPVLREPRRANAALQSQSAKAFEVVGVPSFIDAVAFQLGSFRQNKVEAASATQPFLHESPHLFDSDTPLVPNAEPSPPPGEAGEETQAQTEVREQGEKAELHVGEVDEEGERQPSEEPPWESTAHNMPDPSQLLTEASAFTLQGRHAREACSDAGLLEAAETPNGLPAHDDSPSTEEEQGAAASPSTELHKSETEHRHPEVPKGFEDPSGANGGPEASSVEQEAAGLWASWEAEASSLQETSLLEGERSPSTQQNKEKIAADMTDKTDGCNETRASEQAEGSRQQPLNGQHATQWAELEEGFWGTEEANSLDTEAAASPKGDQDSLQPSITCAEHHTGAIGPDLQESDGGAEDLEVVSTEALHLSEDEEQRALSSPSREMEEGDFQAEMLESEFPQTEEFAGETLSPRSHLFYSAESHQEHHFLGVEQKTPEEETSLSKIDFALPEEEGIEVDLEPEISNVEGALWTDEFSAKTLPAEPRAREQDEENAEESGAEVKHTQVPKQAILECEDLKENALSKEDKIEKNDVATLQDWTWQQQMVMQLDTMESVLRQETSTRDQGAESTEACQGDLSMEQQVEEEEFATKRDQEESVEPFQGDLAMEQQMEEEITTKGQQGMETAEASQGDLSVEQQMTEEEVTTKGYQREEPEEVCQGDLSMEQQMAEEEVTTKREQTVEAGQQSMEQQMTEKEVTTKIEQREESVEACQRDLSVEQQIAEEEVTTKREQTVEAGQQSMEQQMTEEEVTTKREQREESVEACQRDLSVEQQMAEEVTTKIEQREESVEACQRDLSVEQQMAEEEVTTKIKQREESVEACQRDLSVEQQIAEEEVTTKREQTVEAGQQSMEQQMTEEEVTTKREQREESVEACQRDLSMEQQMAEEEVTTKIEQREESVEVCQGDLSVQQQMTEEVTTKRQQVVEACQQDLSMEQKMTEEEVTTKREQPFEVCQGDLSMEQQIEEEGITTKRWQTVEPCQGDLSIEQQIVEEGVTTKREQTVELCHGDLPMEQQIEEEGITTKRWQTLEACQGDLLMEQQIEEEGVTTKREQTVEVCQGDLPMEQQTEEEGITTKRWQTLEACQGDLLMEQQIVEEGVTTKKWQTLEACQGDLSMEQQVEEEGITTKIWQTLEASQGDPCMEEQMKEEGVTSKREQTDEACQGDLSVEQQMEVKEVSTEEGTDGVCLGGLPLQQPVEGKGTIMASPEKDMLKTEDLITESEAEETEEFGSQTSLAEKAETTDYVNMSDLQEKEDPEAKPVSKMDTLQEEEQRVPVEREETYQHQNLHHQVSLGAREVPSEGRENTSDGFDTQTYGGPQEMDLSSDGGHQLQSDHSGCELSLESLEVSPNATSEAEGIEKELESSRHVELEETLPDNTPLHLYDERIVLVAGGGQLLPETEVTAEEPLWTQDSISSVGATGQAVEEAVCPYSCQAENGDAQVSEGVDEGRDGYRESASAQDPLNSKELLFSKDGEEAEVETLGLIRDHEEDLYAREVEMLPGTEEYFPPLDAELDKWPGEILSHGEELAGGEMTHEETGQPDFVWETIRDNVFQPDPSYTQEDFQGGNDSPMDVSDPSNVLSEGPQKISPLTSVADLGEIVLEEEQFPEGQKDGTESEDFVDNEGESGPCAHETQPNSGLENCCREEPIQQTDFELNSSGTDPSPKGEASLPIDSLKDSDILEIVEQALEFNQEVIKAAEQTVGTEQWSAHEDHLGSPAAANNGSSLPLPEAGQSQLPTDPQTPSAPSPNAKDPTEPSHLWVGNNGHGLQQDFTTEILNGTGGFLHFAPSGSCTEELIEGGAVGQDFHRQGLDDQSLLQTLTNEKAHRTGEICPEIYANDLLERGGWEAVHVEKSLLASQMQPAPGKRQDGTMGAAPTPPHFGEDILHLELHPEEGEE